MPKYSNDELKAKAAYLANAEGTAKYKNLIMTLAVSQGMMPATVEQRIRDIANG